MKFLTNLLQNYYNNKNNSKLSIQTKTNTNKKILKNKIIYQKIY